MLQLRSVIAIAMLVETLKDAISAGWRVHARCIGGKVDSAGK
jgi:hypothetical protein